MIIKTKTSTMMGAECNKNRVWIMLSVPSDCVEYRCALSLVKIGRLSALKKDGELEIRESIKTSSNILEGRNFP